MTTTGDEIQRACQRSGVKLGSALERDARQAIWTIAGNDSTEPARSQRIDNFLSEQKISYPDSLENPEPPKAEAEKVNLHDLSLDSFEKIRKLGLAAPAGAKPKDAADHLPRLVVPTRSEFDNLTK